MKYVLLILIVMSWSALLFSQVSQDTLYCEATQPILNADSPITAPVILDYDTSYHMGTVDGTKHSTMQWMGGGVLFGLTLSVLGTVLITSTATGSEPQVIPENCQKTGYREGYVITTKHRNKRAAFGGGMLGSGISLMAFLAVIATVSVGMSNAN